MEIDEQLKEYLEEKVVKFGQIDVPAQNGHMVMGESFSATGFLDMLGRLSEDPWSGVSGERAYDLITNLGEYVPLIMATNIIVKPNQIIEGFLSSMKMFDRGAVYPLVWQRSSMVRNAIRMMEREFFSYNDRFACYETTTTHWTRSNSLTLAIRSLTNHKTKIVICGVIKREDFKFVMSLRRHNKPIPRSLITVLQDEDFDSIDFECQAVRNFYRRHLKEKLSLAGILIKRVPRTVMEALIFRPDKRFSSFDELKEDSQANWRLLVKSRE